jgi:hypothetical protein
VALKQDGLSWGQVEMLEDLEKLAMQDPLNVNVERSGAAAQA